MECAVITPVGPGHQQLLEECRRSVTQAARRPGAFAGVEHIVIDDTRGALGRSHARNEAVRKAQALAFEWIFFLDADDVLLPSAFEAVAPHLAAHDAVWGNIAELGANGRVQVRVPQILTLHTLAEVLLHDPFRTLQMGHFVRTEVAAQHPFATELNTGEDFAYYLQLWEHHRCIKVRDVFFANRRGRHSTGPRSATGQDWMEAVHERLQVTRARLRVDSTSAEARETVNAKTLEYRNFLRERHLASAKTYFALSRVLPYHGQWTIDCYDCPSFVMTSENDDLVVSSILWTGTFEPVSMSVWARLAAASGVVLDIGGYTGVYALVAASRRRDNPVFCFEPLAPNYRRIAANFALNPLPRLTLMPVAVGGHDGEVMLNVFAEGDCLTPDSSLVTHREKNVTRREPVRCVAIDSLVQEQALGRVSLVKIDVEGAELGVLRGMLQVIERDHPDFLIEVLSPATGGPLTEFFRDRGYQFFEIRENAPTLRRVEQLTGTGDLESLNRLVTQKSAAELRERGIVIAPA